MESTNSSTHLSPVDKKLSKDDIETIISNLPREDAWLSTNHTQLYQYQGFWCYKTFIQTILSGLDSPCSSNHTLLCSSPKSGTTWLKALAFAIATRNCYSNLQNSPLLTTFPHQLIPYIESPSKDNDPNFPLLSTHLPYASLPASILDCDCKIVYICRDPKDTFVSLWHFAHNVRPNKDATEPIPLAQAFDLFCRGISIYGPYWDHVLGYWKASLDHPRKVLFLKYEDMMNDTGLHLIHLAEFMGYPFSNEEVMDGVHMKIVQTCNFESLSNVNMNTETIIKPSNGEDYAISNDVFFRKGKVGDWNNYLTAEMADKIDQISVTKFSALDLCL